VRRRAGRGSRQELERWLEHQADELQTFAEQVRADSEGFDEPLARKLATDTADDAQAVARRARRRAADAG
jgi:hypothetical protein